MNSTAFGRIGLALALLAAAATLVSAQTTDPPRADTRRSASARGFSVVLVLGDTQAATTADNVPAAARKALNDMKDFLPYRGYRLLDAQWVLGSQHSTSRLRGTDDQEYQLTLQGTPTGARMHVMFQLREPGSVDVPANLASELAALRDRLQSIQAAARERQTSQESRPVVARMNEEAARLQHQIVVLESRPSPRGRSVIDTSFSMDVGETVVVGTSRVRGGDKALIALLTAVAGKSTGTK